MKININVKPREWLHLVFGFVIVYLVLDGKITEAIELIKHALFKK